MQSSACACRRPLVASALELPYCAVTRFARPGEQRASRVAAPVRVAPAVSRAMVTPRGRNRSSHHYRPLPAPTVTALPVRDPKHVLPARHRPSTRLTPLAGAATARSKRTGAIPCVLSGVECERTRSRGAAFTGRFAARTLSILDERPRIERIFRGERPSASAPCVLASSSSRQRSARRSGMTPLARLSLAQ